jgi:hypothetical protein
MTRCDMAQAQAERRTLCASLVVVKFVRWLSWLLLADDAVAYVELPIGGSPS